MQRVVLVLGYHCAPVEEVAVVKEYLDAVVDDIKKMDPGSVQPPLIIPCGGPTFQRSYPGMTEARRMGEYIKSHWLGSYEVIYEEDSFTTYDNIKGAARILENVEFDEGMDITIWCEATRALKVAMLARHFIGFPPAQGLPVIKIKTSSWELMHPTKELVGTIKEWLAIRLPFLNSIQRYFRIRAAKKR